MNYKLINIVHNYDYVSSSNMTDRESISSTRASTVFARGSRMNADSRSMATDPRVVQPLNARRVSFARKRRGLEFHVVSAKPAGTQWRSMYTRIGGEEKRREASFSVLRRILFPQTLARASLRMQRCACIHLTVPSIFHFPLPIPLRSHPTRHPQ